MLPEHISDLFAVRNNVKNLRGTNKLVVPRKNTTNWLRLQIFYWCQRVEFRSLKDELRSTAILKECCKRATFAMYILLRSSHCYNFLELGLFTYLT